MECGQGGEVIRMVRLVSAVCAPPSFVFPHFPNFEIQELDCKEHFTEVWQIPSETPCMYVCIYCVCVCVCGHMCVRARSVCLSIFSMCVHVFVHTVDDDDDDDDNNNNNNLLSQAISSRYFS